MAMAIASGRLSVDAVPGLASLATTIATPEALNFLMGGHAFWPNTQRAMGKVTAATLARFMAAMPESLRCSR